MFNNYQQQLVWDLSLTPTISIIEFNDADPSYVYQISNKFLYIYLVTEAQDSEPDSSGIWDLNTAPKESEINTLIASFYA